MRIHCISLGCPKNLTDTESALGQLSGAGHTFCSDPGLADAILINTCAFIKSATAESIEKIRAAAKYKKHGRCKKLIVMGCLPARFGKKLRKLLPEVDEFMGKPGRANTPIKLTPSHYAYVKIADGCDNHCTYCTIPKIRGKYHSRPIPSIIKEVRALAKTGTKEVILVAQDTTDYGIDLYGRPVLHKLLKKLAKIRQLRWIRIMYLHPHHLTDDLIQTIRHEKKILKYLDLPLQHICDKILKKMGRRDCRQDIENLIFKIRREIPGVVLRTTFMVGFPGETKRDFEELLEFIEKVKFERLGVFKYSKEDGTPAAKMRGQVSAKDKDSRFHQLMQRQNVLSKNFNRNLMNKVFEVLVDTSVAGGSLGRTYMDAPEIDGSVFIPNKHIRPGKVVLGKIFAASDYDLSARLIN